MTAAQHSGSSAGTDANSSPSTPADSAAGGTSTAGPAAAAWTWSSRPGHRALNGPNTSPDTTTRSQPGSPGPGRKPASAPPWHQSLRTVTAPGVHHRHPGALPDAVRATASFAAADIAEARGCGSAPTNALPSSAYAKPPPPAASHAARRPAEAAASACALAPVTKNAWAARISSSTKIGGHRISSGSSSPRSSLRAPRTRR